MEKRINLIPSEMAVPPQTVKAIKIVNKVTTIGVIVLIVLIVGLTSFFVFASIEQKNLALEIEDSKLRIQELEKSEQQLILAKDRLGKIGTITNYPSVEDDILNFSDLNSLISNASGSALVEANIQDAKTDISVNSKTAESLELFLSPVAKLTKFKSIILTSLGFGSTSGFISDLTVRYK